MIKQMRILVRTILLLVLGERHFEKVRRWRQEEAPFHEQMHHWAALAQHLHGGGVVHVLQALAIRGDDAIVNLSNAKSMCKQGG